MTTAAERDHFDTVLQAVIQELPGEVRSLLDEVAIVVDDEPSREMLEEIGAVARPGESDLCGLHGGLPLDRRSVFEASPYPDQILIFRGPIQRLAGFEPKALERQIRITLLHEIGHHFGLSEEWLHKLGYG